MKIADNSYQIYYFFVAKILKLYNKLELITTNYIIVCFVFITEYNGANESEVGTVIPNLKKGANMNEVNKDKLCQLLIRLRNSRDISRNDMGRLLGVSGATVKRWERGESMPSMDDVVHICNEFNLSLEEIYEGQVNIDKEVDRKLLKFDVGLEAISNDISNIKDQFEIMQKKQENNIINKYKEDDLSWLWLLVIHLVATLAGFLCFMVSIMGFFETFICSIAYVLSLSYLFYKKKNSLIYQKIFLLYSVFVEINLVLNYILFAKAQSGLVVNAELLSVNGAMYGFHIFDYYNMKSLFVICMVIYTSWAVFCGYNLFKSVSDKGSYIKKTIIIVIVLFTVMCLSKTAYDSQYGVGYYLNDSGITIHLDKNYYDRIAEIWITSSKSKSMLYEVSNNWNTDITKTNDYPITYYVSRNEDGTYFEYIVLRFFMDEFDKNDAGKLIDYLGINEIVNGSVLCYNNGLLQCDRFRYKYIIDDGIYTDNISFTGEGRYEYKGETTRN